MSAETTHRSYVVIDGRLVRRIRVAQRIPLAELAKAAEITRSYLTSIETRDRPRVSVRVLAAIETRLGLDNTTLPIFGE